MHRIIFLGTSEFATPTLEALLSDNNFHIDAVITQPDRPVGRHATITPPPVKTVAERFGLRVFQPEKLKELQSDQDFQSIIKQTPDAFVVVSYGKILPPWFLEIPKQGTLNVHGSLLPLWRGASPIQAAIAAGDKTTGVTIMKIDELLDHGPILATDEETILETDTGKSLHDRIAERGAKLLPVTLSAYLDGILQPRVQDHSKATSCYQLNKESGKIDWNKTSEEIERMVRAYNPWPSAWIEIEGKRLKILLARVRPNDAACSIGERFLWKGRPSVKCGQGTVLELVDVQPEGKKPMSGEEFARGNREWITHPSTSN
jgi:methionyl-tRNA formyltransferase